MFYEHTAEVGSEATPYPPLLADEFSSVQGLSCLLRPLTKGHACPCGNQPKAFRLWTPHKGSSFPLTQAQDPTRSRDPAQLSRLDAANPARIGCRQELCP